MARRIVLSKSVALSVTKSAAFVACSFAGGHLGVALFGVCGGVAGAAGSEIARKSFESLGQKFTETVAHAGLDFLSMRKPGLEEVYRLAIVNSLAEIQTALQRGTLTPSGIELYKRDLEDWKLWFENWRNALEHDVPRIALSDLQLVVTSENASTELHAIAKKTLEELDAIGRMPSGGMFPPPPRTLPDALYQIICADLPFRQISNFEDLLSKANNIKARYQLEDQRFNLMESRLAQLICELGARNAEDFFIAGSAFLSQFSLEIKQIQHLFAELEETVKWHVHAEVTNSTETLGRRIDAAANEIIHTVRDAVAVKVNPEAYIPPLNAIPKCFGKARNIQLQDACTQWLTGRSREHCLLVLGTPGIGKSVFARTIMRLDGAEEKFGARRFELQCDAIETFDTLLTKAAETWFGLVNERIEDIPTKLRSRLAEHDSAVLLDNFETLLRSEHEGTADKARRWLSELAGIRSVWLIVAVQGRVRPNKMDWPITLTPLPLSIDDAVELFIDASGNPGHANDPRLRVLLKAVDCIPHWVVMLGGKACGAANLSNLQKEWVNRGMEGLMSQARQNSKLDSSGSRDERMELGYKFAIESLPPEVSPALRIMAWLPGGLSEEDVAAVLPRGDQDQSALYTAALVEREGDPFRLRMVRPLREYAANHYPAQSGDIRLAVECFLSIPASISDRSRAVRGNLVRRIGMELPNILAAMRYALQAGDADIVLAIRGLGRFSARSSVVGPDEIEMFENARDFCSARSDQVGEAWCLLGLAHIDLLRSRYSEAGLRYREAFPVFGRERVVAGMASCQFGLGEIERYSGRYAEARERLTSALSFFIEAQNRTGQACCELRMGSVELLCKNYGSAESHLNNALLTFEITENDLGRAWCLESLGDLKRDEGLEKETHAKWIASLVIYEAFGETSSIVRVQEKLALAHTAC